ncbi:MOSC domain-containing protein [Seohaeicola zhoushanensis]|uniref:Molybdenum cofactor sulfurase n=1 Tax=Seohaeicola zhoushanensis TaxID=1569283 RepID=A0A8J3GV87_9RHOB|nr:sulfurase [Seohaeicola zhoushanensis]GHF42772.1 molybdenum cofactor sulfurase [Seohaeicola zhoushanensis]
MPTLIETEYTGEVTWLGHVPASRDSLRAEAVDRLDLTWAGDTGARHEGTERPSCVRVKNLYARGTKIRNVRQLTLLSAEEMADIAAGIGLAELDPCLLGISIVLRGIPDFTHVPPSSRLQGPSGVTLTVDMENRPCVLPGREIEAETPGHGTAFKTAAEGRRGVTAWVERPGLLAIGDKLRLFIPDQRAWAP